MIAVIRPGGTIADMNVVLRPNETLPNHFNTPQAQVYREDPETYEWTLLKPIGSVLPSNSEVLTDPVITNILELTNIAQGETLYEHVDIIRLDETSEEPDSGDNPNSSGS